MMTDAGRGIVYSALKTLRAKWDGIESHWQDSMRQLFVAEVWEPLQQHTTEALEAMDQIQVLLTQMRRECEGTSFDIHQS